MTHRLAIFLAALWWGSLTALGFMVVPLLFTSLGSPAIAGAMAAKLFTAQTWLSVACTMLLLLVSNRKTAAAPAAWAPPAIKFVVAGLLLALLVEFGVSPRIVNARAEGGNLKLWHAMGSAMYLLQWCCAGLSLWHVGGRSSPEGSAG
ncbi:MAG: putative transrane protein [Polaromonas sp.]|nr:putative transrane protein [Polaromonas sp.]